MKANIKTLYDCSATCLEITALAKGHFEVFHGNRYEWFSKAAFHRLIDFVKTNIIC